MTWFAVGAAVVGAGATIYSANQQADAAQDAANTQAGATGAQLAEQRRQFDVTQANYQPFIDTAHRLLPQYENEVLQPLSNQQVLDSPGYQFGLSEGQKALDRQQARAGGRISGAAIRRGIRYATDYATTGYGAEFARREARLARMGQLAGLAPINAASQSGQASTNAISSILGSQGDAAAASQLAQGNIWGGAVNSLAGSAANALRNYGNSNTTQNDANYYNNLYDTTWQNQSPSYGFDG